MGIACEFIPKGGTNSGPFMLVPRSSISATPLMLANSIGIIDAGYRGAIRAKFRCYIDRDTPSTIDEFKYVAEKGLRIVQLVAPDLMPIRIELVDSLTETERGANGFGSTGTNVK
jgi:dUTP pyrophosphatase